MGNIEGFQALGEDVADRPTDQEVADKKAAELAEAREKHNEKTGGGNYPTSDQRG